MGFADGARENRTFVTDSELNYQEQKGTIFRPSPKPKRKLSSWNKFVKANSRKKEFRYANGKLKLKKMGIAFRRKRR